MISIELIMIITNICVSVSMLPKDIAQSNKCNETIIKCVQSHIPNLTNEKFSNCIIQYEVNKQ